MGIGGENVNVEVRDGGGNVPTALTVVGMSGLSGDSSGFAEGFLFLRPVFTILCSSTVGRGTCSGDVCGCVGQRIKSVTRLRRIDYDTTPHRAQRPSRSFCFGGREMSTPGNGKISRKKFKRMCTSAHKLIAVKSNALPFHKYVNPRSRRCIFNILWRFPWIGLYKMFLHHSHSFT